MSLLFGFEGMLVLLAAVAAEYAGHVPGSAPIVRVLPVFVLVAGGFLAWRFHRGRALLGLLAVAIGLIAFALGGIRELASLPVGVVPLAGAVVGSAAAIGFARERGIATLYGPAAISILALWLLVIPVGLGFERDLAPLLAPRWLPADISLVSGLPELVLIPAGLVVAALFAWSMRKRDGVARASAWGALGGLAALGNWDSSVAPLYLAGVAAAFSVASIEEIRVVAFHDPLTGLPARRALEPALAGLTPPYVVAMVDVDHFKRFNDTFGHAVGDQVLAMVASRLEQAEGARAFRYGGEEFTLLLPGRSVDEALPALELVRAAVEATTFKLRAPDRPRRKPSKGRERRSGAAKVVAVTISIGVAAPEVGDRPAGVLRAADQALYQAKEGGRNRIAISGR